MSGARSVAIERRARQSGYGACAVACVLAPARVCCSKKDVEGHAVPHPGVDMGALHKAEGQHQDQHGRSAIADQWKGHADHRRKAHDHRHVHREEQERTWPRRQGSAATKPVACWTAPRRCRTDDQRIKRQQENAPRKPNSSASVVKMKSVCFSGRKFSRDWVPCMKPRPVQPPEPSAIFDWVM